MTGPDDAANAASLVVHISMQFKRRGGRKVIIAPSGEQLAAPSPKPLSAVLKAVVQAHKWNRMLVRGDYATIAELAKGVGLDKSYVSKMLRLVLLAPKLVEAIVWGVEAEGLSVERLLKPFPPRWEIQAAANLR